MTQTITENKMIELLERQELVSFTLAQDKDILIIENVLNIDYCANLDKRQVGKLIKRLCKIRNEMVENEL